MWPWPKPAGRGGEPGSQMGSSTLGQGGMPPQKVGISGTQSLSGKWGGMGLGHKGMREKIRWSKEPVCLGHQEDQSCLSPSGRVDQLGRGSAAQRPSLSLHGIILPVMSHKRPPSPRTRSLPTQLFGLSHLPALLPCSADSSPLGYQAIYPHLQSSSSPSYFPAL